MVKNFILFMLGLIPEWLRILLIALVCLILLTLAVLLTLWLVRKIRGIRWKYLTQWLPLEITNTGNLPAQFRMRAIALEPGLNLKLFDQDHQLPTVDVPLKTFETVKPQPVLQPVVPPASQVAATQTELKTPSSSAGLKKSAADAKGKAEKGLGKVKLFGTLMGTLGGLLPGAAGAEFKKQSTAIQSQAQSAGATLNRPEEKMKTLETLKGQSKNLVGIKSVAQADSSPAPVAEATPQADVQTEVTQNKKKLGKNAAKTSGPVDTFSVTPPVETDGTLQLLLQAEPIHRYGTRTFNCWVSIIPWLPNPPEGLKLPKPQIIKKAIRIKGYAPGFAVLSALMILSVIAFNVYWLFLSLRWLIGLIA